MVSRNISLFGKMQRGRSPSFELNQLDMYARLNNEVIDYYKILGVVLFIDFLFCHNFLIYYPILTILV